MVVPKVLLTKAMSLPSYMCTEPNPITKASLSPQKSYQNWALQELVSFF